MATDTARTTAIIWSARSKNEAVVHYAHYTLHTTHRAWCSSAAGSSFVLWPGGTESAVAGPSAHWPIGRAAVRWLVALPEVILRTRWNIGRMSRSMRPLMSTAR